MRLRVEAARSSIGQRFRLDAEAPRTVYDLLGTAENYAIGSRWTSVHAVAHDPTRRDTSNVAAEATVRAFAEACPVWTLMPAPHEAPRRTAGTVGLTRRGVVTDSLLHREMRGSGRRDFGDLEEQRGEVWRDDMFALDDEVRAKRALGGRGGHGHAAVVGNPPYITVKDDTRREVYRGRYERSARGKHALSAPFMERFFGLARKGGFVGQITANSFMKREFGKGLVESVLPGLDVTLIVSTARAYIRGHGTPTVLVFGRARAPESAWVGAVLARRWEPSTPERPDDRVVWASIRDHWGDEEFENEDVAVERIERGKLAKHPW
ncbi:MAG: hypothetical protein JNK45_05640, partial [Myxococcales bacterium]|nr:hypothetical protein [Myxococcales bacterium]